MYIIRRHSTQKRRISNTPDQETSYYQEASQGGKAPCPPHLIQISRSKNDTDPTPHANQHHQVRLTAISSDAFDSSIIATSPVSHPLLQHINRDFHDSREHFVLITVKGFVIALATFSSPTILLDEVPPLANTCCSQAAGTFCASGPYFIMLCQCAPSAAPVFRKLPQP